MCWIALRAELTREANELSQCGEQIPPIWWVTPDILRHHTERIELKLWEAEYQRMKADRRTKREKRLADRPPCPYCGAPVERDSKRGTAKVPIYCSPRCMAHAKDKRWREKHGAEYRARRKAA
jgi:endogenous inhibitor of DNA gyrase (YacG/DUF329 family)